jgi:Mitochondrial carrier protein
MSFWRGNWANIFRVVPNAAFRFAVYDKFKQYTSSEGVFLGRLTAGSATGMLSLVFHYPFDVIRVRMACDMTQYKTTR